MKTRASTRWLNESVLKEFIALHGCTYLDGVIAVDLSLSVPFPPSDVLGLQGGGTVPSGTLGLRPRGWRLQCMVFDGTDYFFFVGGVDDSELQF